MQMSMLTRDASVVHGIPRYRRFLMRPPDHDLCTVSLACFALISGAWGSSGGESGQGRCRCSRRERDAAAVHEGQGRWAIAQRQPCWGGQRLHACPPSRSHPDCGPVQSLLLPSGPAQPQVCSLLTLETPVIAVGLQMLLNLVRHKHGLKPSNWHCQSYLHEFGAVGLCPAASYGAASNEANRCAWSWVEA